MSAPGRAPRPGPVTRFLLDRRVGPAQRERLLDELRELHEHRVARTGARDADRWLRREYRRLTLHLALGGRIDEPRRESHGRWHGDTLADVRQSVRGLSRAPLFSAAICATLALGIGGTTLVYAIVDSVLIAPLPYPGGERMVLLRTVEGENMWSTSMADLHALEETPPDAFETIAAYTYRTTRVAAGPETELLRTKWVTPDYFPLLGVTPERGRHLSSEEGVAGGPTGVLVTAGFRDRSFPAAVDVVGRSLLVDGTPMPIVGVLPDRLGPLDRSIEVFPVLQVGIPPRKGPFFYPSVGRLREDVAPEVAREQLVAVSERIFPRWQDSFTQPEAVLGFIDLKEALVGNVRRTLWIVLSAVGFLLLIASANSASLLVARALTRSRELSVRSALGASTLRVLKLLLAEAVVIASVSGAAGLVLALAGLQVVQRFGTGRLPRLEEIALGPSGLGFFVAITVAASALLGLVAAGAAARNRTGGVAAPSARSTPARSLLLMRRVLVAGQFAVAVPLLTGAVLLLRSLDHVRNESYGFDPDGLATMLVTLPEEQYPSYADVHDFWARVLPDVEALPGVAAAGLADARPPLATGGPNNFVLEGAVDPGNEMLTSPWITADAGFFRVYDLAPLEGRLYAAEPTDTMRRAVVDQNWVERFSPDAPAIGRRFRSGGCTIDGCPWTEIVGVVDDVKTSGVDDTRRLGTIYYDFARDSYGSMTLHVRARGEALSVVEGIRSVIRSHDAGVPVSDVRTVHELANEALRGRSYTATLVALLAAVALALSVVGVYGVMAYFVRQHARDIGIRIALGGGPGSALLLVVRRGLTVAGIGTVVGIVATPWLIAPVRGLLYGVAPNDPLVLGLVAAGTLGVACAATALPGRQAARTDPAVALREE